MICQDLIVGPLQVFCYLVACSETREGVIIDPGAEPERILEAVRKLGLKPKLIINTHGHIDHIGSNKRIKEMTGASIAIQEQDKIMLTSLQDQVIADYIGAEISPSADILLVDNQILQVGELELKVLHTPGHSPGSICLLVDNSLFTGDTLFVGGIGRTDLPGGSYEILLNSIKERIITLAGNTKVFPGHDYGFKPSSTIAEEKRENPFLQGL